MLGKAFFLTLPKFIRVVEKQGLHIRKNDSGGLDKENIYSSRVNYGGGRSYDPGDHPTFT